MVDVPGINGFKLKDEVLAPAMHGCAFRVNKGDRFQIIDPIGQQVGDLVVYKADNPSEFFSPAHTITQNSSVIPKVGDMLVSNRRNALMHILEDSVGYHDMIIPCCDSKTYSTRYDIFDHRSCLVNILEGLESIGLGDWEVYGGQAWNIFMRNKIESDGKLTFLEPKHGPNSYIQLEALEDLVVGLSACPQDQTPTNGPECTEMLARIWSPI